MSSLPSAPVTTTVRGVGVSVRGTLAGRLADYLELAKPRIAVLALVTVTVGYVLGSADALQMLPLFHALLGIALVAAGSSALNQFVERRSDARMRRTADRPLPSGRLHPVAALGFGLATGLGGCAYLAVLVNVLTASLALATLLLYTLAYTPLKRITSLCTAVGAVPGALPPLLGWTASGAPINSGALSLFAILYVWQFPHFLAIVWLYRDEYADAGFRMLPAVRPALRITGIMAVTYALALLPVSLLPGRLGLAGDGYLLAAAVLGIGYLLFAVRFAWNESAASARGLVFSSLVYLPSLLTALTWDHFQLLSH